MSTEFKEHQSLGNRDRKPLGGMYVPSRQQTEQPKRLMTPGYLTMALVLVFVGLLWYAYPREGGQYDTAQVPIIRADTTPYKERPVDPEGMEIPYMESQVFNTLVKDGDETAPVENLLEPAETPIDRADIEAKTAVAVEKVEEAVKAEVTPVVEHVKKTEAKAVAVAEEVKVAEKPKFKTEPILKPMSKPEAKTPAAETKSQTKPAAAGSSYVQLGAFGSEKAAKAAWGKFTKQYGAALSGFNYRTQSVTLASGKTLYRLQAGPVAKSAAKAACTKINAKKKGSCLVK